MTTAAQPTMVPGYRHVPGNHCGSTALRNLLAFHGLELSEEMAFGLGAGACFYYVVARRAVAVALHQRAHGEARGAVRRADRHRAAAWTPPRTPSDSWRPRRATSSTRGRPALLLSDLYFLDHYGKSAHFPGHAVVLAGYDDEVAYLSDTAFEELQTTRLENLAKARHAQHPVYPLAGHMFSVARRRGPHDPREAVPRAIERAVEQMFEPALGEYQGLPALGASQARSASWPDATEDWQWCARFNYQVIERRGTGGGNFRRMYARFLEEAGYEEARSRPPPPSAGRSSRRRCTRRASPTSPSRAVVADRRRGRMRCSRPSSACGAPLAER